MTAKEIKLDGIMNIAKAEGLFHELEEVAQHGHATSIQAASVTRVDTAVLQLLAAFVNQMNSDQISVSWDGVSDAFREAAVLSGMEQVLNL